MEVILIEPVRKLGNVGDIVKVKNGFARNYLIPNKKALRTTQENIAYFESKKAEIEKQNKAKLDQADKIAKAIEGSFVVVIRQAGDDGRLYGSVSALDIARGLSESSKQEVDRNQVVLNTPIKYIGIYEININLHGDINAKVNINVSRTEGEAKDAEKRFKRGEKVMEGPGTDDETKKLEEEATTKENKKAVKEENKESLEEGDKKTETSKAKKEAAKEEPVTEAEASEEKAEEKPKKKSKK